MTTDETDTIEALEETDTHDGATAADHHEDRGYVAPSGGYDDADEDFVPVVKQRRRVLTGLTAVLAAGVVAAAGFFGGVQVQKHQGSSAAAASTTGTSGFAAFARRFAGAGGAAGATGTGATGTAAAGAAGAAGGAPAVGSTTRTVGTVKLVDGSDVYVTNANGDTVLATTNKASTLTKTATATLNDVTPGSTVVVTGIQNKDGSMTITSLSVGAAGGGGGGFGRGGGFGGGGGGAAAGG